jgi:hypothetical protein
MTGSNENNMTGSNENNNRDDVMELVGLLTPEQAQSLMQQMSREGS